MGLLDGLGEDAGALSSKLELAYAAVLEKLHDFKVLPMRTESTLEAVTDLTPNLKRFFRVRKLKRDFYLEFHPKRDKARDRYDEQMAFDMKLEISTARLGRKEITDIFKGGMQRPAAVSFLDRLRGRPAEVEL